ncbi:hypothetical protein [Flavobacterium sp.]
MPKLGTFPSKEADLSLYFQEAIPYVVANKQRLGLSPENKTIIEDGLVGWNIIFPASQSVNTRTKTIVENKDFAKNNLINALRTVYGDIPQSVLTIEDRNALNLPAKDTSKTPASVPTSVPIGHVNTNRRLQHTIIFTNEDSSRAKPVGVRGCQIWYRIGEMPTTFNQMSFMAFDSASPYVHVFDGADAGKIVYYWLRWENTRGEVGPWSEVIVATITA